jgi:DHA1 family tetracycline resistance protein-like MFS transporter
VIVRLLPILGITFIDILGFSILLPLMPYFAQRFGAAPVVIGLLFSVFALCQLIAGPVWGNVSDRIGRKAVLIISQIGATIGWTMLAFAPNLGIVFLARIIEGLSGGNISVTQAYVADLVEPEKRARAFAYIGAAFSAGLIFGPAAGGWLVHQYGFATPFLFAAGLQLLTLIVTIVVLPESKKKDPDEPHASFADIVVSLRDRTVAPVLWQKLVYSLGLYGWFAAFTLILQKQLGLKADTASYFFVVFGLVSIVMQLGVVGRITDAMGDRRANNCGLVSMLIAFAIAPFLHDLLTAFVLLVFFAFGLAVNNATIASLISHAAPENQRGTILGVGSSLESASGVIMPPVTTGALEIYGVAATAGISALFALIALIMGIAQTKPDAKEPVKQT